VGLIAREVERRGIATVCLSSAWSITRSVNPPRAVFLDFPLGHTAGRRHDKALQRRIMIDALSALDGIQIPGTIRTLPYRWDADDAWKDRASATGREDGVPGRDDRVARLDTPQYQTDEDRVRAERHLARAGCPGCIWLEE
jgi:hypothetical protein